MEYDYNKEITNYDLYRGYDDYVPDIELVRIEGDAIDRSVWFLWRGTEQWLKMSAVNAYDDGYWLIVETKYTDEFDEWLAENLSEYDSLENLFDVDDIIPTRYNITFKKEND